MKKSQDIGVVVRRSMHFKLGVAGLVGLLVLLLIALRFIFPFLGSQLEFVTLVLTAASGVYSAFYIGESIRLQVSKQAAQAAFELMNKFNEEESRTVATFVRERLQPTALAPTDAYAKITEDSEVHEALKTTLNKLESLSIAIVEGYADERIVYKDFRTTIDWYWNTFRPYIEERRKQVSITFYENFESVACAWNAGRYAFSGRSLDS